MNINTVSIFSEERYTWVLQVSKDAPVFQCCRLEFLVLKPKESKHSTHFQTAMNIHRRYVIIMPLYVADFLVFLPYTWEVRSSKSGEILVELSPTVAFDNFFCHNVAICSHSVPRESDLSKFTLFLACPTRFVSLSKLVSKILISNDSTFQFLCELNLSANDVIECDCPKRCIYWYSRLCSQIIDIMEG